jgi:hypothetical protein
MATDAGWYPDPSGRHGERYFTGEDWSARVRSEARGESFDTLAAPMPGPRGTRPPQRRPDARHYRRSIEPDKLIFATAAVFIVALVGYLIIGTGGISFSTPDRTIDPTKQDDGCHRAALASASNNQPGFEWNGYGMDYYRDAYDACLEINRRLGE